MIFCIPESTVRSKIKTFWDQISNTIWKLLICISIFQLQFCIMVDLRLTSSRKLFRLIHKSIVSRLFQLESFYFYVLSLVVSALKSIDRSPLQNCYFKRAAARLYKTYMLSVFVMRALQLKWISGSEYFMMQPCSTRSVKSIEKTLNCWNNYLQSSTM